LARPFTPEQSTYILSDLFTPFGYYASFPEDTERTPESIARHRRRFRGGVTTPVLKPKPDDPQVMWDKSDVDFHWTDVLEPLERLAEIRAAASGAQDHGHICINSDTPVPVVFLSDWHIGSWGTSHLKIAQMTQTLVKNNLRVALLGDLLQMSIKMRGVLEMSDNALPPGLQQRFLSSWYEDIARLVLWATWDNHAVTRQEDAMGFSPYAEVFKHSTIYHSGIGHIDLQIGDEVYKIASSHKFRGNTSLNPVGGQKKYMRFEGIDRELTVAGDSHRPAMESYFDGPLPRLAINCGSLQEDSGYAKRYFSLYTHDAMPVVLFYPNEHRMVPYMSLEDYLAVKEAA
jgi:hypothetical protein